ncbi:hypothetical protein NE591_14005, partial [Adlercreutzia sp. DFI.6.23]|nr:hypothetical protein [Adlercreutzia sp. DFI.6.23]
MLHSGHTVGFSNCREGDVAVLANELSNMVSRLSRTRDQLSRERNALADSLADVSYQAPVWSRQGTCHAGTGVYGTLGAFVL